MKMNISLGKIHVANHTWTNEFTGGKIFPGVVFTGERGTFLW